jgi:hypothetical protein
MRNIPLYRPWAFFILVMALTLLQVPASYAQWSGPNISSFLPLSTIEHYMGPIFSGTNMSNTFRSEFGLRFSAAEIMKAHLTGSKAGTIDLSPDLWVNDDAYNIQEGLLDTYLNGMPVRLDAYVNFRIWRFGLRANYSDFHTRSNRPGLGGIVFSGLSAGADFDVVKMEWLTMGVATDWYFYDPMFFGFVPVNSVRAWQDPLNPTPGTQLPNEHYRIFEGSIRGNKPVTIGTYSRYVPPEILGFPVYFESALNYSIKGSRLFSYGAALVFRPQIYRFDIALRLKFQRLHIEFEEDTMSSVGLPINRELQSWQIDATWNIYGVELAMYF